MLSPADLTALRRSLRDEHVLSVFVDRSADDPAEQRAWRTALDDRFVALRRELRDASDAEREAFERCIEHAVDALAKLDRPAGAPGWLAFITTDGVRDARSLAAGTQTTAMWSKGAWLVPCLRDIKEDRAVVVVVADARHASMSVYRNGSLEHADRVRAHHETESPPLHMGAPSRQGFHSGTRGTTGHDAAQRGSLAGRDHMIAEAVERVPHLGGPDAWILVGGVKGVRARFVEELGALAPDRVLELDSLDVHASDAEIAVAARAGASALRDAFDSARIREMLEAAGPHGLAALGSDATKDALDHVCVRQLYLTTRYAQDHAMDAELAVRAALDQNATVEGVSGRAAELLDGLGGIAASLRFRPTAARATAA